jgi:hypothetical protein
MKQILTSLVALAVLAVAPAFAQRKALNVIWALWHNVLDGPEPLGYLLWRLRYFPESSPSAWLPVRSRCKSQHLLAKTDHARLIAEQAPDRRWRQPPTLRELPYAEVALRECGLCRMCHDGLPLYPLMHQNGVCVSLVLVT